MPVIDCVSVECLSPVGSVSTDPDCEFNHKRAVRQNRRIPQYCFPSVFVTAIIGFLLLKAFAASGQQLVQNGGFETGDFTGWTQSGYTHSTHVITNATYVHSGMYGAELGPDGPSGFLSQNLATAPGQSYGLSLWLYCDGRTFNFFQVSWNGAVIFDQTNIPALGWTNLQFTVTATSTNTVLQFQFLNSPSYFGLDEISVTSQARPPNDNFTNAAVFPGFQPIYTTITTSNINATKEFGEPDHAGNPGGASVWWTFTTVSTASVTLSTAGSTFDTLLAVYTGNSVSDLTLVADNEGCLNCDVVFTVQPSMQYYVAVDGYNGGSGPEQGNINLTVDVPCPPPEVNVIYEGQTTESDGVHFLFCAQVIQGTVTSYNWDHGFYPVITNSSPTEPCYEVVVPPTNEDLVTVDVSFQGPCNFGFSSGSSGSGTTCEICLSRGVPNVLAGKIPDLGLIPIVASPPSCGTVTTNAQWYKMIATNGTGPVTVSTQGSSNATFLAVFDGPLNALTNIACDNGLTTSNKISIVNFIAIQGINYWIAVDPRTNNAASNLRVSSGFQPSVSNYGMSNGVFTLQSTISLPITYQLRATTNLTLDVSNWPVVFSTNLTTNYPYLNYQETNMKAFRQRFYILEPSQ